MVKNISIISIRASLQNVWDTITDPALVKQWQYGSDLATSWIPGDPIRFTTAWEGQTFEQWGTILDVQPLKLVRYSLFAPRPGLADAPENYFTMNYILTAESDQVTLEIIQEDDRPVARQEALQGEENPILKLLKDTAEAL